MEWTDEGIVLGVRRHGESSAIVELLTRSHGRHLGLVRGGSSSRLRPLLQPGNSVTAVWRARLDEHLGYYQVEGTRLRAALLLASSHAVYGVTHLASLARLLPERDPHEDIYEMLDRTLDDFDDASGAAAHLIRFELAMLAELGFGLVQLLLGLDAPLSALIIRDLLLKSVYAFFLGWPIYLGMRRALRPALVDDPKVQRRRQPTVLGA